MLAEERRKQLDGIVQQMVRNRESDNSIQFVVSDFKNKYSEDEPEGSFREKTASVLDAIFGGGKLGEAIGTKIAKIKASPEEKEFIEKGPPKKAVAGSILQSASLFAPGGTVAKGITGGVRALGLVRGASALGKISSGVLAGELFDVATNLQQGKSGRGVLTPGLGAILGGAIPGVGVTKNVVFRFGDNQAPRVINSLIKPLAKDFSYGKNPGRAVAEEGIVANNFDDLLTAIHASRKKTGQSIGELASRLSEQPLLNISKTFSPLDKAIDVAAKQNNPTLLNRLNNVKRAITDVLEPSIDDAGNMTIKSVGGRNLTNLTFKQTRDILGEIGDMTAFTGNPSDDKLVNSALKQVYGNIKGESLKFARDLDPTLAREFEKLTEKYADLTSAEVATRYRDKIVERQNLIGLSPQTVGIGAGLITAVATGGATIPAVLAGVTGAVFDKLASTPGFKTRLAYLLSTKKPAEVNYLFRKIPALKKFFSLSEGVTPGDVILGNKAEGVQESITGYIKNPKLGASIANTAKNIPENDRNLMIKFIDHTQTPSKVPLTDVEFNTVETIARGMGISMDEGLKGVANKFRDILEGGQYFSKGERILKTNYTKGNGGKFTGSVAAFKNFTDLSTKLLKKLEGRTTVSKQFISDLTNSPDLKQAERDLFREVLKGEGDTIDVKKFANKVRPELLRLKANPVKPQYEGVSLPDKLRGPVANYSEHLYESPIKTSAGQVHYGGALYEGRGLPSEATPNNYFAHTRIEDLPNNLAADRIKNDKKIGWPSDMDSSIMKQPGNTRRVIELQSDLFQKGRLEGEGVDIHNITRPQFEGVMTPEDVSKYREAYRVNKEEYTIPLSSKEATPEYKAKITKARDTIDALEKKYTPKFTEGRDKELSKLEPYRNTWHERVIREEVKKAAQDGKTKLQFPTGETAMKIEGLGQQQTFDLLKDASGARIGQLTADNAKVGSLVADRGGSYWIITDVLGDGKFKAVPKDVFTKVIRPNESQEQLLKRLADSPASESFDISGKVDTNNPIYKFYEKEVGRYLTNKYGAKLITDPQGVKWWEVPIKKEMAKLPIEAFGLVPFLTDDE